MSVRQIKPYRTNKGEGSHIALQLNAKQKCDLTIWIYKNKAACETLSGAEIVKRVRDEIGLSVSYSSVITIRNAVYPDLKMARPIGNESQYMKNKRMMTEIESLSARISRIEKDLGIMPI